MSSEQTLDDVLVQHAVSTRHNTSSASALKEAIFGKANETNDSDKSVEPLGPGIPEVPCLYCAEKPRKSERSDYCLECFGKQLKGAKLKPIITADGKPVTSNDDHARLRPEDVEEEDYPVRKWSPICRECGIRPKKSKSIDVCRECWKANHEPRIQEMCARSEKLIKEWNERSCADTEAKQAAQKVQREPKPQHYPPCEMAAIHAQQSCATWNRVELYNEVWDQPLVKLSRKYGISDVRLGKVCRKLKIPHPGRGFWAKRAVGQTVERMPLPEFKDAPVIKRLNRKSKLKNQSRGKTHTNLTISRALSDEGSDEF